MSELNVYTIAELAARWRCSRHTIMAAIREARLHAFKIGGRVYRVRRDEVERYEAATLPTVTP